jgi:glutamate formiminotransferase
MAPLFECVPNVSEARDIAALDAIDDAIRSTPDAWLLDRTSDVDHARSVFTVAGSESGVRAALEALVAQAVARIDMRNHQGQHPRIGAVDVVPFVPLGETPMEACIELARSFGAAIAEQHDLPVFLYGEAALKPARRVLADVRRPRFEGLGVSMATDEGAPDIGPQRPHPSAGAVAVGARQFLIAYNIQLVSGDVRVAREIASRIRERDGGLHALQALGLQLGSQGHAQVSMNLLDFKRTSLWAVWEAVSREAAALGTAVLDSELIGLVPSAALAAVADHIGVPSDRATDDRARAAGEWLRIREFDPRRTVESRLEAARKAG